MTTQTLVCKASSTFWRDTYQGNAPFGLVKHPHLTLSLNCSLSIVCCIINCFSVWVRASSLLLASCTNPSLQKPLPLADNWCPNTGLKAFSNVAIAPWGPPTPSSQTCCVSFDDVHGHNCATQHWLAIADLNGRSYKCTKQLLLRSPLHNTSMCYMWLYTLKRQNYILSTKTDTPHFPTADVPIMIVASLFVFHWPDWATLAWRGRGPMPTVKIISFKSDTTHSACLWDCILTRACPV